VPKVQATMAGPQVLDVENYPTITFVITSFAIKTNQETRVDGVVTVTGPLWWAHHSPSLV
jgi:polyisoprenoid-binding protein YceI